VAEDVNADAALDIHSAAGRRWSAAVRTLLSRRPFATAYVGGIAALLLERDPTMDHCQTDRGWSRRP
jgi:hypothetical protein